MPTCSSWVQTSSSPQFTPIEAFTRTQADAFINILAETNTKALATVDPARQQLFQASRRPLMQSFMDRSAVGELRWVITLFPTDAYAQDAGMSTEEYAEFVFEACKLNHDEPVAAWQESSHLGQRVIEWLADRKTVHLTAPGTDLFVDISDRVWVNCDGARNFPDGEVFTGPVETGVNGTVSFTYPVVIAGQEIEGIRLTFKDGQVVDATADRGKGYLDAVLETDDGARRLGEFAVGTNFDIQRFSKNILFDEKIGGTVHMAIGAGAPETGSVNRSAVHLDMVCDLRSGGEITVDGDLLLKDGKFAI